jgi:hypothetical protein
LQGTHRGPLKMPRGTIPPTGKRMDAPCADVFELVDDKIKRFDCYPSGRSAGRRLDDRGLARRRSKPAGSGPDGNLLEFVERPGAPE